MKNFFCKLSLISLLAVLCGVFSSCDPTQNAGSGSFSVSVKEAGPEYVVLKVTAPASVQMAYLLDTKEKRVENPVMIFSSGESLTVKPADEVRISSGLEENTQYYLYVTAKLDAKNYSEIFTLPFKTSRYELNELLTVVDQSYDGYKVRITVPEETKERGNAIRFSQCCVMMYNYAMKELGSDDYKSLLYNGARHVVDNTTVVYSEETNWYQTDEDSNGDGELDLDNYYNPISPGEPVVFIGGEFAFMEGEDDVLLDANGKPVLLPGGDGKTPIYPYPSGWEPGYYMPLLDTAYYHRGLSDGPQQSSMGLITDYEITTPMDEYWTGAFQRKHFRIRQPEPLDGKVDVELVQQSPIDIVMNFLPDENVAQYAVGIFDDNMYANILELCNGREDYLQWAMTSYFGAYSFGTRVATEAVQMKLSTFYYQDAINEDTKYHVFVTAMGNNMATTQSFQKYTFSTTKKTKDAPVIEVTALQDESTPYLAKFNVKCTTAADGNPVTECYYAANYKRDWLLAINGGSTYQGLVAGNKSVPDCVFSSAMLEAVNSPEGYDIAIPSVDGEVTRIAILGYNDEYTPNDLVSFKPTEIEDGECPGIADCTTPWLEMKDYVDFEYEKLVGEWTAKATLQNGDTDKSYFHESKITITDNLNDFPTELPDSVYTIYKETSEYEKEKVDGLWTEFKLLASDVAKHRLEYQNRLLCLGWLDDDSYGRLDTYTPYELFIDRKYKSVDVSSIYNDYGPKWYIEAKANEDGTVSLSVPFDSNFLPPAANWSVPFYLAGMELGTWYSVTYGDGWTPSFPVEVSENWDKITIKPLIYTDKNGTQTTLYPQMIGIDNTTGQTILENPVVSEIVLTKGAPDSEKSVARKESVRGRSARSVQPEGLFPETAYLPRTELKAEPQLKLMEGSIVTEAQFKERADKLMERTFNLKR